TSWTEMLAHVEAIASGLLQLGIEREQRVAILSATRPQWMEADLAALAIGCVTVPIYPSNLPAECGYILIDSGARVVFVENAYQAEKIQRVAAEGIDVAGAHVDVKIDTIVVFDDTAPGCLTLAELCQSGLAHIDANRARIEQRTKSISSEQLATIVYTSGTTGLPKGVMQSHGNHLAAISAVAKTGIVDEGEVDFSFLPFAHSFGRMMEYLGICLGTVTAFAEKIETLTDDLRLTRPHFLPAVPRIFEKIYSAVQQARAKSSGVRAAVFDWAISVGKQRAAYVNRGCSVPVWLAILDSVAHQLVFTKIHQRVGGRMSYLISGGAPLATEINEFFHAVGLTVLEGYGLTETTPILTCNVPGNTRIGTVGRPLSGVTLRIAEDGEILAKGPNIAYGYYRRPEETAEAWDSEGWFHTGDIGELDGGFLRITDRKKELIKTAGGKYVAPQKIENLLKSRPLISQAVVIGDRLKYCVALLTLDAGATAAWAARQGLAGTSVAELSTDKNLLAAIEAEVAKVNEGLASFESVKYFRVLPGDFSVETGELTPSLKLKRKAFR
ncbi:MAG: AMP-dependent synthetase/ligase, partial [Candidatus Binatia bacterium]